MALVTVLAPIEQLHGLSGAALRLLWYIFALAMLKKQKNASKTMKAFFTVCSLASIAQ